MLCNVFEIINAGLGLWRPRILTASWHNCKEKIACEIVGWRVKTLLWQGMCISVQLIFDNELEGIAWKQLRRRVSGVARILWYKWVWLWSWPVQRFCKGASLSTTTVLLRATWGGRWKWCFGNESLVQAFWRIRVQVNAGVNWSATIGVKILISSLFHTLDKATYPIPLGTVGQSNQRMNFLILAPWVLQIVMQ